MRVLGSAIAMLLLVCVAVNAEDVQPNPEQAARSDKARLTATERAAAQKSAVLYSPPRRGTPRAKVGGGVRGVAALPRPLTLAPPHLALTGRPAPTLYWYLEALPEAGATAFFTLTSLDAIEPVVEQELSVPQATGIHPVDLASMGVALEPETEYQWSISIVRDPERRNLDLVDSSYLWRIAAAQVPDAATTADLAAESLWYEALESAVATAASDPRDEASGAPLKSLLEQAELRRAIP